MDAQKKVDFVKGTKTAWVLRLKKDIAKVEFDGQDMFLCDDESIEFLTDDLQQATLIYDKEQYIKETKAYDKFMIERFGKECIRNGGWEHISKHFDFVEVMLEERN